MTEGRNNEAVLVSIETAERETQKCFSKEESSIARFIGRYKIRDSWKKGGTRQTPVAQKAKKKKKKLCSAKVRAMSTWSRGRRKIGTHEKM